MESVKAASLELGWVLVLLMAGTSAQMLETGMVNNWGDLKAEGSESELAVGTMMGVSSATAKVNTWEHKYL